MKIVDLRDQLPNEGFAFWDEKKRRFMQFNGQWAWGSVEQFIADGTAMCERHRLKPEEILPPFIALARNWMLTYSKERSLEPV